MFGYEAALANVERQAREEFDAQVKADEYKNEERRKDRDRNAYAKQARLAWQATQDVYASIDVRQEIERAEIRCLRFNGSITVSRPKPDFDFEGDDRVKKVRPGYINASSWEAGNFYASPQLTADELRVRIRMMDIAVTLLNQYNAVVLDWKEVENPFECQRRDAQELTRYRENEARERAHQSAKAEKKAEKK